MNRIERLSRTLDPELAKRVAGVLRRGLYEVVLEDRIVEQLISDDPDSEAIDLNDAASLLRCDRVRDVDGTPMPDVRISWGCGRWIHYPGIAEDEEILERIHAVGREHATIAAEVLEGSDATEARCEEIERIVDAIGMTCASPSEGAPIIVDAATPWAPLAVFTGSGEDLVPTPVQPDDDLTRLAPHAAWAGWIKPFDEPRGTIRIDSLQSYVHHGATPDPIEVMRTVLALRGSA